MERTKTKNRTFHLLRKPDISLAKKTGHFNLLKTDEQSRYERSQKDGSNPVNLQVPVLQITVGRFGF